MTDLMIHRVRVNRSRTAQEAINATGRRQFTDTNVVHDMPKGEGDEVDIVFFKPEPEEYTSPGHISDEDLEKALLRRNYANDPLAVVAVNEADPALADERPHATHWKDSKGNWCYATFRHWDDGRGVRIYSGLGGWDSHWWFAGVRKYKQ